MTQVTAVAEKEKCRLRTVRAQVLLSASSRGKVNEVWDKSVRSCMRGFRGKKFVSSFCVVHCKWRTQGDVS